MGDKITWNNRIVGHGEEDPEQLLANPGNWRIHPRNQQEALAGAISDVGFIRSVTVNKTTGHVVDGHLRVTLALRNGEKSIPVEYVELNEAEEAEALLTLDPIAAMAASDRQKLEELMVQVQSDQQGIQQMLADLANQNGIGDGPLPPMDAPEDFQEYDEEIETQYCCPKCNYKWSGKPA